MAWQYPDQDLLREVTRTASGTLLIASPFVSRRALDIVADNLPTSVTSVEFWTRLALRDWMTGASDHEALADFIEDVSLNRGVRLLTSDRLHTKLILSSGSVAVAGSANLTNGGYFRNIELVRASSAEEIAELQSYAELARAQLTPTSRAELDQFLGACLARQPDRQALLELIAEFPSTGGLQPVQVLEQFCRQNPSYLTNVVLGTSTGTDRTNRTGHVHQSFFTIQRFFQEHPEYVPQIASSSLEEDFEPASVPGLVVAWVDFMRSHAGEAGEPPFQYAFSSMIRNLPPAYGGDRTGGGGWVAPFKRAWPITARIVSAN